MSVDFLFKPIEIYLGTRYEINHDMIRFMGRLG